MSDAVALAIRFRHALSAANHATDAPWVVAVSGGLDSVALLHLLRFAAPPRDLVVAHFDHAMRDSSAADARWVVGLCRAWDVPARTERAETVPTSEAEARAARYAFLEDVRREVGASLVLTAHHADDQAETVLFRAVRGTGPLGLAGMRAVRDRIFRPLLPFWREDLAAYAERARLSWREDPSNALLKHARNAIRHRVLPDLERLVAPGARRALVRLADRALEDEAAWESLLPLLLVPLSKEEQRDRLSVDHPGLAVLHPAVRARILRALVARVGCSLDEAGTRLAVDFVANARSGSAIELGGSVSLRRDLDRIELARAVKARENRPLEISGPEPGSGSAVLDGYAVSVTWGGADMSRGFRTETFDPDLLRFPLCVRARRPGDRIRLSAGTKKVKKLLLERRIPLSERARVPLVVDAAGEVLWIPGVARAERSIGGAGPLSIGVG